MLRWFEGLLYFFLLFENFAHGVLFWLRSRPVLLLRLWKTRLHMSIFFWFFCIEFESSWAWGRHLRAIDLIYYISIPLSYILLFNNLNHIIITILSPLERFLNDASLFSAMIWEGFHSRWLSIFRGIPIILCALAVSLVILAIVVCYWSHDYVVILQRFIVIIVWTEFYTLFYRLKWICI